MKGITLHWRHLLFLWLLPFHNLASTSSSTANKWQQDLLTDFRHLASDEMAGRKPSTSGHELAQNYIVKRYQQLNLPAFSGRYRQLFYYEHRGNKLKRTNLVAHVKGSVYPQKYIVVTAHYDHLGQQGRDIYNGADDNASGVAGMLSLAQKLSESGSKYSVIFVATDAEEEGLLGAKAFLKASPVPISDIVLNINLDMISQGGRRNTLYIYGGRRLPKLYPLLKPVAQQKTTDGFRLRLGKPKHNLLVNSVSNQGPDWKRASDHYPFYKQGIDFLYFGVGVHRDYHKTTDTLSRTPIGFYLGAVSTIHQVFDIVQNVPPSALLAN